MRVFLLGDAVACAHRGQQTANGYYNVEQMLVALANRGATIGACGTCLDARGIVEVELAPGVCRSSMPDLANWTTWADQVMVF